MQASTRGKGTAYRVAEQGANQTKKEVLINVRATAAGPVPDLLRLPRPCAERQLGIAEPVHALELDNCMCRQTCIACTSTSPGKACI